MPAYDAQDDMLKIKSMQKKFRESFTAAAHTDLTKWDMVHGTGTSMTLSGGQLTFASGTTVNAESYLMTKDLFTVPFRLTIGMTLSQRIINQTFFVEAVSVDPNTGVPDGQNTIAFVFDGTTATSIKYRVGNGGLAPADTSATFPTTASGSVYELEPFADEAWFHGGLIDSNQIRSNSYRRHTQVPDPNSYYKIRLRWLNGGTAPASSTNAVIQYIAVQDYAELTAEITAGRGQSSAGQALGVQVIGGSIGVSGTTSVAGAAAHDAAGTGNPVKIGAKAINVAPSPVSATGDISDLYTTMVGALIQKPYAIPEADWSYSGASAITTAVSVALKAAGAAGMRNYATGMQIQNTGATATEVQVLDGATVIWRGFLPANMLAIADINFMTPLRGTAATAMNFNVVTAGANVYVNAQGYQAP